MTGGGGEIRRGTPSPAPEAMGRFLTQLGERIGVERIDRVWVFPSLVRGRREWGLVKRKLLVYTISWEYWWE